MDHLEQFEDLVSAIIANGVLEDYLFCKLFKYSLFGDASHWLKHLPPGSLTSWIDVKNAFLRKFFYEGCTKELRSKIATHTWAYGVIQKTLDEIQVLSERLSTPWIQRHRVGISDGSGHC